MSTPYIGEIKLMAFNFPPKGWAECNGQILPINQNQALFSLLGTFYGGNGTTNFALPNFQSRVAVGYTQGPGLSNYNLGQTGGEENHTLTVNEMPLHTHTLNATSAQGNDSTPVNNDTWAANSNNDTTFSNAAPSVPMSGTAIGNSGVSQPHQNTQPYLTINFCIALQGIFPSRN